MAVAKARERLADLEADMESLGDILEKDEGMSKIVVHGFCDLCTALRIRSCTILCYVFLHESRCPAWSVGSYNTSQPAGGIT